MSPDNKPSTPATPTVQEELRGRADDAPGHDPADRVRLERQNEQLRRTQAALEVSLERYRDLYENAPVGYVTTDADTVIVQANRMAARLMERPVEALIGQRLTQFMVRPTGCAASSGTARCSAASPPRRWSCVCCPAPVDAPRRRTPAASCGSSWRCRSRAATAPSPSAG